jgi:DNA-directed RNA polymerase specialized sigma24 family protein
MMNEAALDVADDAPDPLAKAVASQESGQLQGCLAELESRTQRMIQAAFFDGLAYSQLAERADVH